MGQGWRSQPRGVIGVVLLGTTPAHPLAPLVVSNERKHENQNDDNGKEELHYCREQEVGNNKPDVTDAGANARVSGERIACGGPCALDERAR